MEVFTSQLPAKAYCKILRMKLDSPFYFFDERINGVVLGHFFSIAHHAPWEWNRQVTAEINRAMGVVREVDGETKIYFLRSRGGLCISWFLIYTVLSMMIPYWIGLEIPWYTSLLIGVVIAVIGCFASSFLDGLTENGQAGAGEITRILKDPKEYDC